MSRFIISCGGTGGHLAPGIALAEGLMERGHECSLIISCKQVDSRLVSDYPDIEYECVPGVGFSLKPVGLAKFVCEQAKAVMFALRYIRKKKPDMIVGFGGFTTVGMVLAGFLLGCPVVLHEANRRAGKAVRLLSVIARRVYLPPGVQLKSLPPKTIRHLGYPVRKEVRWINKQAACRRLGITSDCKRLLVLGGSQGAAILNKWVLDNFERLGAHGIHIYCVTGLGKLSEGKLEYTSENGEPVQAIFRPFVDNMAEVLCCADLVVTRSGAGSVAELIRCQLPSILIPYPWAADRHQEENARFLERQGGGVVLDEQDMDRLFKEVVSMIFNDWLLYRFQQNLKSLDRLNSLEFISDDLEMLSRQDGCGISCGDL